MPSLKDAKLRRNINIPIERYKLEDKYNNIGLGKTYYVFTYGCQGNEADSEVMSGILEGLGFVKSLDPMNSDLVLLNTCAIREKAQEKIFNQLFSWKAQNQYKENAVVCVGGCVASQEGKNVITRAPMVSVVFGPQTIHRVPDMINKYLETGEKQVDVSFPSVEKFDF